MNPDSALGDIALVWSWESFLMAIVTGFGFGYLAIGSILAQEKWKSNQSAATIGWLIFVLSFGALMVLDFGQTFAAILEGDPAWPRVLSRLGQHMVWCAALAIGTASGLGRARTGGWVATLGRWWGDRHDARQHRPTTGTMKPPEEGD